MAFDSNLKLKEPAFEERRGRIIDRRHPTDRRKHSNPDYRGPSRRMTLDRRQRIHDRRDQD